MSKYTVTITYTGITKDAEQIVAPICRVFAPQKSYIDTDVYTQGVPTENKITGYGKSVYATNVPGWGELTIPEPYASTSIPFPVPMAQFKVAMVGEDNKVTFEVDSYMEAFYYKQIGVALESQGFTVEVVSADAAGADEPEVQA